MKIERFVTETEKKIIRKRGDKNITPDQMFSYCRIQQLADVYKTCGGKAAILYFAIVGNHRVANTDEPFKLFNSFLFATGLNKTDVSRATTKLEDTGYIKVKRKAGHKNLFTLTKKGKLGKV